MKIIKLYYLLSHISCLNTHVYIPFISIVILMACSSKKNEEKLNAQSIIIHNSMIRKANEIEHQLKTIRTDTASGTNKDSVEALLQALYDWEKDLMEVPGDESHEQHEELHHHDHKASDVTAEQMLHIQQELDTRLSHIGKRLANVNQN